jgi:hypothetical protein
MNAATRTAATNHLAQADVLYAQVQSISPDIKKIEFLRNI